MTDDVDRWLAMMAGSEHAGMDGIEDRIAGRIVVTSARASYASLAALAVLSLSIGIGSVGLPIGYAAAAPIDMMGGLAPSTLLDGR